MWREGCQGWQGCGCCILAGSKDTEPCDACNDASHHTSRRHPGRGRKVEDVRGPRHRASRSLELDSGGSLQDEFL